MYSEVDEYLKEGGLPSNTNEKDSITRRDVVDQAIGECITPQNIPQDATLVHILSSDFRDTRLTPQLCQAMRDWKDVYADSQSRRDNPVKRKAKFPSIDVDGWMFNALAVFWHGQLHSQR